MLLRKVSLLGLALLMPAILAHNPARAALFDDTEARKRILQIEADMRQRDATADERMARLETSIKNLGLLELVNQIDELKGDLSKLRGQIEVLNNQIGTVDKKQRDFYLDLDSRLRRLEPPSAPPGASIGAPLGGASAEGNSGVAPGPASSGTSIGAALGPVAAEPAAAAPVLDPKEAAKRAAAEKKSYDAAYVLFKKKNYAAAIPAFQTFIDEYPGSASAASAQYWIGLANLQQHDLKGALRAQQNLVKSYPESPKVPDALLAIAAIRGEMGECAASRRLLEELIARHPGSDAAVKARQRLAVARN